jgi:Winged helix DNA-binding domain
MQEPTPDALEIARRRMRSQRLWGERLSSHEDAVRWLVASQAQELPLAAWSLGIRTKRATAADVDRALADGRILRTHVLRPTWHFVLPEDIRWLLALTGARVKAKNAPYVRRLGLDDRVFARTTPLLADACAGGHRTRRELGVALERAGVDVGGLRLQFMVSQAELDAVLCNGSPRGKQQTYALVEERAPRARAMERDEALAELGLRYARSRGPVTAHDFSWWSGLTVTDARRGLETAGPSLHHEVIDGQTLWFESGRRAATRAPVIDLVPTYDERIVSYGRTRDVPLTDRGTTFHHAVLLNGLRIGRWRLVRSRESSTIQLAVHRGLDAAERDALGAAVARLERFLRTPLRTEMVTRA